MGQGRVELEVGWWRVTEERVGGDCWVHARHCTGVDSIAYATQLQRRVYKA